MKKLMFAAIVAVAASLTTLGATCSWYVGYVTKPGDGGSGWGSTLLGAGDTDYTATLYLYTDSAMTSAVDLGTGYTSTAWDDGFGGGEETGDVLNNASETTYYGKIVVTHGDSTLTSQGFQFTTSTLEDTTEIYVMSETGEIAGVSPIGGASWDATKGAFSSSGWSGGGSSGGVPEPTSGLLLVVGGAMLALRRKR